MSYSRFGWDDSSVYVYLDCSLGLRCCMCPLQPREWVEQDDRFLGGYLNDVEPVIKQDRFTTDEMFAHLQQHRDAGHVVPDSCIAELLEDRDENDAFLEALGV